MVRGGGGGGGGVVISSRENCSHTFSRASCAGYMCFPRVLIGSLDCLFSL